MQHRIKVGVYNWSEFSGKTGFYPEDLPWEWRLSYFSNEFETACMSLTANSLDSGGLFHWTEYLADSFDLSFALSQSAGLKLLTQVASQNNLKVTSLVMENRECDILLQLESWKSLLSASGLYRPEQFLYRSALWSPDQVDKSSAFAVMPQQQNMNLYRHWIEQWLVANHAFGSAMDMTLWVDGECANPATLSKLRTLVELMGY